MKKFKKWAIIFAFVLLLIGSNRTISKASSELSLNTLDFQAQIQADGNMQVTEIWDINIKDTNTLYKSFKANPSKYSRILDVKVTEITDGNTKEFKKVANWAYHVEKDAYYGAKNKQGQFEIGWGVNLENGKDTRKYQIQYTVKDAITKWQDQAELYWQFVGNDFEVDCKKITGTILLPQEVTNQDQIKVWGHTKDMNGTINIIQNNKIAFEVENYKAGRYVEIRTLFPTEQVPEAKRVANTTILETALQEEGKWAEEANQKRKQQENKAQNVSNTVIGLTVILDLILLIVAVGKIKKLKTMKKQGPEQEIEYFRDIPRENASPAEVIYLLKGRSDGDFEKIFPATLMDLNLKQYLKFEISKEEKKKETIKIQLTEKAKKVEHLLENDDSAVVKDLPYSEMVILEFIEDAFQGRDEITMKELQKYIRSHPDQMNSLKYSVDHMAESTLIEKQMLNPEEKARRTKYRVKATIFMILMVVIFTFGIFVLAYSNAIGMNLAMLGTVLILLGINLMQVYKIISCIPVFTQETLNETEQWKGLKRFLKDFSKMKNKEVPEIVLWEKFLVYATAFGMADKVIEQLKVVYPNIQEMNNFTMHPYFYIMMSTNFNKTFSQSISTSISSTYTSGSGMGGGFSAGGGFGGRRRWRWW